MGSFVDSLHATPTGGAGGPFVTGELVRVSGNNTVVKAQADILAHTVGYWGVVDSGSVRTGGPVGVATAGSRSIVLLEPGLIIAASQTLYISATMAGRATNAIPAVPVSIGSIVDATPYALFGYVFAVVGTGGGTSGVGAQGAQGFQGAQGGTGSQGSQGTQGAGAQGASGAQGTAGAQGAQGSQGSGAQGAAGAQGAQGPSGGAQGDPGPIGPQGSQGPAGGAQGFQGVQGSQGSTGAQGFQGATGTGLQGAQGNTGSAGAQGGAGAQGTAGGSGAQGPVGGTGLQGAQGATGTGAQGGTGTQGAQGSQGAAGSGSQGAAGAQGVQGAQGFQGVQGSTGTQGAAGAQGSQGVQGSQGASGAQGIQGSAGTGAQGAQGTTGAQGPSGGAQGSQGTTGAQGFQGSAGGAQGFQGATGAQGFQGFQGTAGAQGTAGTNGSQGAQGAQGFQGAQGSVGAQGSAGAQGATGSQGTAGAQGSAGVQGSTGAQGATGGAGAQGLQGGTGVQGSQGAAGAQGSQGTAGAQGSQGFQGSSGVVSYGGAPPQVASASAAGVQATVSRSDHTHGLDIVVYAPTTVAMQVSGVLQQAYSAPNATPSVLTMVAGQIPFGAASTGLLTQSARLTFTDAATAVLLVSSSLNAVLDLNNTTLGTSNVIRFRLNSVDTSALSASQTANATACVWSVTPPVGGNNTDSLQVTATGAVHAPFVVMLNPAFLDSCMGSPNALAAATTVGFLWQPTVTGALTGVPGLSSAFAGSRAPTAIDTTNHRFYAYIGGAWHFSQFMDYDPTATRVPFGGATAHTLTDSASLNYVTGTGVLTAPMMTITSSVAAGVHQALLFNQASDQGIVKTGGTLFIGTGDSNVLTFVINSSGIAQFDTGGNLVMSAANSVLSLIANTTQGVVKSGGLLLIETSDLNDITFATNATDVATFDTSGNLTFTMIGAQILGKTGGSLYVGTLDSHSLLFLVNNILVAAFDTGGVLNLEPASLAANGAVATALTSVGPTGSHTTVQEWWVVKGSSGVTRYVPLF